MESSDQSSVRIVMEIPGDQDPFPSEATSRCMDLGLPAPRVASGGVYDKRRWLPVV
ncbi:UNVERIFIED_CONTAM: hypothetical protein Slati_3673300 [Sesamum latifolium]|uniref:Uncharacterized protein n=1 Tax=Sesamum latifolium TaxID=2727402 RepID=A0AAW2U534_9LAMI